MPAWLNLYLLPRCILLEKCPKIERAARARAAHTYIPSEAATSPWGSHWDKCTADRPQTRCPTWTNRLSLTTRRARNSEAVTLKEVNNSLHKPHSTTFWDMLCNQELRLARFAALLYPVYSTQGSTTLDVFHFFSFLLIFVFNHKPSKAEEMKVGGKKNPPSNLFACKIGVCLVKCTEMMTMEVVPSSPVSDTVLRFEGGSNCALMTAWHLRVSSFCS